MAELVDTPIANAFRDGCAQARMIHSQHPTWGLGHWTRYLDATRQAAEANAGKVGKILFTVRLRGIAHVVETEILPIVRRIAAEG